MKKMLIGVLVVSALAVASHAAEPAADRVVQAKLRTRVQKLDFDRIELGDVIQFLRDVTGINIHVKWNSLADVGVKSATPVTLHLKDVTIEKVLRLILADLGQTKPLDYAIADGILTVSSREDLEGRRAAPTKKQPAEAQWTDVLKLVDLKKHVVHGRWTRKDGDLHSLDTIESAKPPVPRVLIPVSPSGSYEVDIMFVRKSGEYAVAFVLPVGQSNVCVNLNYGPKKVYGLTMVNGQMNNETTRSLGKLSNGEEHRVHVRVLLKGGDAEIAADLDGKELLRWKGKQSLLSVNERRRLPDAGKMGLAPRSPTIFKNVRFRQLRGETSPSPLVPRSDVKPSKKPSAPTRSASVSQKTGATPREEKARKLLEMAITYEAKGMTTRALDLLGTIILSYPGTPAAKDAKAEYRRLSDKSRRSSTTKPDDS